MPIFVCTGHDQNEMIGMRYVSAGWKVHSAPDIIYIWIYPTWLKEWPGYAVASSLT
jgi:hypothetical protein